MTTLHLRVGFMPLVDCALVVLAKDEGFAETEGLNLELVREVSWSNLRDKLNRDEWHWTATPRAGDERYAWMQLFYDGDQLTTPKGYDYRAVAVRRVPFAEEP